MMRAPVEEPARCIVSEEERKHLSTSKTSVVVHGLWRVRSPSCSPLVRCSSRRIPNQWLELTARTIWHGAERVIRLPLHLATHSDQAPDCYLAGVKYDPLIPTWFGAFFDVHEGTWFASRTAPTVRVVVKRVRVKMKEHGVHGVRQRFMYLRSSRLLSL
jgi:hypothetical protein